MKLNKTIAAFTLGLGMLLGVSSQTHADWYNDCCYDDPCCYEGPLTPCSFRLGLRGGVAPTWFTDKGDSLLISDDIPDTVQTFSVPDFDDVFDTPWTIAANLGYAFSDSLELFLEGNYTHADGKRHTEELFDFNYRFKHDGYTDWGLYAGARYHFCGYDMCGCRAWPFLGVKFGAKFYDSIKVDLEIEDPIADVEVDFDHFKFWESSVQPSIGAQLGFEAQVSNCFTLVFMAEAVWSGHWKHHDHESIDNTLTGDIAIAIGDTGPLFQVPITAGFNWVF
jgi:hypothetical protein